jgi:hypothetical protein
MEMISNKGRTANIYRVGEGLVCKMPRNDTIKFVAEFDNAFEVERQLLTKLGVHRRIVRYVAISMTMQF